MIAITNCTKDVTIPFPDVPAQIVVDGQIEIGSPPLVFLLKTRSFNDPLDPTSLQDFFVRDAMVHVSNGADTVQLEQLCVADLPPEIIDDVAEQFGVELSTAKREMTDLLRDRYKVRDRDGNPFTIRTTEEFIEQTSQVTGIFQTVLVAIASISLLVGGIGIMNIMLVSVTERTREIGLRMGLGAKKSDIRNQFLVEAAVLCVIGGAMGLLLALAAGWALTAYAEFPVPIGLGVSVGAIIFSALVGLIFGGWPAVRASRLSPIEALRTE